MGLRGIFIKPIKYNFYTGTIKSIVVWLVSLLIFFYYNFISSNSGGTNSNIKSVLLISIVVGVLSYSVLIHSLYNLLEIKIKKYHSFLKFFIIIIYVVFLIFCVPILVLLGMTKLDSLINKYSPSSKSDITTTTQKFLDENKLLNLINDWEKTQGYQQYLKDDVLCEKGEWLLNNDSVLYNSKNWFEKTELNKLYFNASYNLAWDYPSEKKIFDYWISNKDTLKNLKDAYFQYSCIKCIKFKCIQVFANIRTITSTNTVKNKVGSENYKYVAPNGNQPFSLENVPPEPMTTSEELFTTVNNYREAHGLNRVNPTNEICNIATIRAQEITTDFSHNGMQTHMQNRDFGNLSYSMFGENLWSGSFSGVHIVEYGWDKSPGHKGVLLDNWSVGCVSTVGNYAALIFAR